MLEKSSQAHHLSKGDPELHPPATRSERHHSGNSCAPAAETGKHGARTALLQGGSGHQHWHPVPGPEDSPLRLPSTPPGLSSQILTYVSNAPGVLQLSSAKTTQMLRKLCALPKDHSPSTTTPVLGRPQRCRLFPCVLFLPCMSPEGPCLEPRADMPASESTLVCRCQVSSLQLSSLTEQQPYLSARQQCPPQARHSSLPHSTVANQPQPHAPAAAHLGASADSLCAMHRHTCMGTLGAVLFPS